MGKQQRISSSRTTKDAERNLNASLKTEQLFTSKHSVAINRTSVSTEGPKRMLAVWGTAKQLQRRRYFLLPVA